MPSPVSANGVMDLENDNGLLICLDAFTERIRQDAIFDAAHKLIGLFSQAESQDLDVGLDLIIMWVFDGYSSYTYSVG